MTNSLRILHIVRQYYPAIGGLESYVRNMTAHQRQCGHRCAVLTLNRIFPGEGEASLPFCERIEGMPVYRVPFLGGRRFFIPFVSPAFLKRYDIIHVHNTDGFFDFVSLLAKAINKPVFATTHGGFFHTKDFSVLKKIYFNFVTRRTGKNYRALFAISQNDRNIFKGVNDNLLLRPNAIVPPGDFVAAGNDFVYLGRLSQNKNVAALIETFYFLKKKYQITGKLHIIGPEWDVTRRSLCDLALKRGIEDQVVVHGFLGPEALETVLRRCRCFFSASLFEGFGMSMLEAMAVGLLPFVQPNESFKELIEQGGIGKCVDFNVPEVAAKSIATYLEKLTAQEQEQEKNQACDFARQFSWEKLAQDTLASYREFAT